MEPTKISFSFSKRTKNTIISNKLRTEKKLELVECLEGKSIKVKDAVEVIEQPLIIPLKDNQKNLLDRIRAAKSREKSHEQKKDDLEDTRPDSELNPNELAARQLIREAKDRLTSGNSVNNIKVPLLPIIEGATSQVDEPTLEDYESIPITDYGLAILRGMGWKEGMAIGKNIAKSATVSVPELRPKGLGLGATKIVKSEIPTQKAVDKEGNELVLAKGCCAKIIAGPYKGNYCEVQGLDEDAGRVIIKVYPKGDLVNINELFLVPVTKNEFSKGSKILNNAKYEEYKEISDKKIDNYKIKSESSDLKHVIKDSKSPSDAKTDRSSPRFERHNHNSKDKSNSPYRAYKKVEIKQETSKYLGKNKNLPRKSRSRSNDNKNYSSSQSNYKRDDSTSSTSSNPEEYKKEKDNSKYRSSNYSEYKSKQDKLKRYSSDEDHHEKDKKNKKHTKSKNRDRSRSHSRDKLKKDKKHNRDSSGDDNDYKKEKRKRNKCKSRHRRNSSSSSENRMYKSKR